MKRASGLTTLDVVIVVGVVTVLFTVLMPMYIQPSNTCQASHCQSNSNQIGKALKMYLSDWDDTFPVNGSKVKHAPIVRLSDPQKTDKNGKAIRFQYGVNWVEALQPYVEKVSAGDAASAWRCDAVPVPRFRRLDGRITYAFNANMVNKPEGIILNAGTMMMVRELGRLDHAVLRPKAPSYSAATPPENPFLNAKEASVYSKYKLHGDGSNVLFADGHVKSFNMRYFPKVCQWDGVDKQWYNFAKLPAGDPRNKSIAVSP